MRIAIPMDEMQIDSTVCPSFGRAPYYLLYNATTGESEFLDNAAAASQGGAGIRAAQVIADRGAHVLISERCGENAAEVLGKAEVMIFRSVPGSARENIDAYLRNELVLLSEFRKGMHGHG